MENIKLEHGDAIELIKSIPDNSIDLIVTDPPYEIGTGGGGFINGKDVKLFKDLDDLQLTKGYDYSILDEFIRVMKKVNIYIYCSKKQIPIYLDYFVKKYDYQFDILTLHKTNPMPLFNNSYMNDTEYIMYFREKGVCFNGDYNSSKKYFLTTIGCHPDDRPKHPTIKPLEQVKNFIYNSSNVGDIVLDPFMGSGTTGVACKELDRDFIGYEVDIEYFDIAKNRIEEHRHNLSLIDYMRNNK